MDFGPLLSAGGAVGLVAFIVAQLFLDKRTDRRDYKLLLATTEERAGQEQKVADAKIKAAEDIAAVERKRADDERALRLTSQDENYRQIRLLRDQVEELRSEVARLRAKLGEDHE